MTSKFFKCSTESLRRWVSLLAVVAFPIGLGAQATPAPSAAASPGGSPKKIEYGYIRFWALVPASDGAYDLFVPKSGGDPEVISSNRTNFFVSSGYEALKPGRYDFSVARHDSPKTVIDHVDVMLRKDVFITVMISIRNGKPKLELIDDTIDPSTTTARVTVRQYLPETRAVVSIPKLKAATPELNYGDAAVLDNLPRERLVVTGKAIPATGPPATSSREVDLAKLRHTTFFLVRDVYGRFRPRLTIDGQNTE